MDYNGTSVLTFGKGGRRIGGGGAGAILPTMRVQLKHTVVLDYSTIM
jgi:hypothetical protein